MIGLALEGGGAKGAYHVGAVKALYECGIVPELIAGTSIGAINGAILASGKFKELERLWEHATLHTVVSGDVTALEKIAGYDFRISTKELKNLLEEAKNGLSLEPMREQLRQVVDAERISRKRNFGLVTYNLSKLRGEELMMTTNDRERLIDYIVASSALPIFEAQYIDGDRYFDGGFYNNLPIDMLFENGASEVYAIKVDSLGRVAKPLKENAERTVYISPSEDTGNILDISPESSKRLMLLGYLDTMRVLKKLERTHYYVKRMRNRREYEERAALKLVGINETLYPLLSEISGKKIENRWDLFEQLKKIAKKLELGIAKDVGLKRPELKKIGIRDFVDFELALYSKVADKVGVQRYHLYEYDEFLETVERQYHAFKKKEKSEVAAGETGIFENISENLSAIFAAGEEDFDVFEIYIGSKGNV